MSPPLHSARRPAVRDLIRFLAIAVAFTGLSCSRTPPDPAPAAAQPLGIRPIELECKDFEVRRILFSAPNVGQAAVVSHTGKVDRLDRYDLTAGSHIGGIELTSVQSGNELMALSPDAS